MSTAINRRLKALEQRLTPTHPPELFIAVYGVVPDGWSFEGDDGKRVGVMRQANETDKALNSRAANAARDTRNDRPPILFQVVDYSHDKPCD